MAPTHSKRHSDGSRPVVTAGFTPGGHIPSGYSYLQHSHSIVTPTRRTTPKGMESPQAEHKISFPSPIQNTSSKVNSSLNRSTSNGSLTESMSSPRLARSDMEMQVIADLVSQLPPNPKIWTPSQVALYLTQVLGLTPKPVVEDVTNYVRRSHMGGKVFMRLREKDLESEGLNLKWRKLMIEAVKKLRRDCLRGRIWGYEGGLQLPRQDDLVEDTTESEDLKEKLLPITAMGTLKRLRDKKAIRGMISSFENPRQDAEDNDEAHVSPKGDWISSSRSSSSVHSNDSKGKSGRVPLGPIYGEGFVKSRAESFTSLNDLSSDPTKRRGYTREELEHWFGSLSDQEAEALANELQEDEELQRMAFEEQEITQGDTYSLDSSISGLTEAVTPPPVERGPFHFTPIEMEIVDAIVSLPSLPDSPVSVADADICVESLRHDLIIEEDIFKHSQHLTQVRPGVINGGKTNPYRSSTYEPEEIEALGLITQDEDDIKFGTAKKISRPSSGEDEDVLAEIKLPQTEVKRAEGNLPLAKSIFRSVEKVEKEETDMLPSHMRHMSAHEASGISPYRAVSPAMSRKSSQRRNPEGERNLLAELVEANVEGIKESNNMATCGRKAGASSVQLSAMLQASGIFDGPGAFVSTAEDESEWGITVSRKASRRGTLLRSSGREKDGAASRMAELFSSAPSSELNADNLKELEKNTSKEHLYVPMTMIEPSEDGKGSTRKHSMVLVERKRFEALARRMGVLESQIALLEAASLPSLSDLGSVSNREAGPRSLEEVYAVSQSPHLTLNEETVEQRLTDREESVGRGWIFPSILGALPSYALGLGAGIGFVLFQEVMGKSRR